MNCNLIADKGVQDINGYHLAFHCTTCNACGIFVNEDKTNIQFDEEFSFDKSKYSCPNSEYEEQQIKLKNQSKLQIRKKSIVITDKWGKGEIVRYASNNDIIILTGHINSLSGFENIIKTDIIEVLTY